MNDEIHTFTLSLRRWSDQPDDAPPDEMMQGAADIIDRLLFDLTAAERALAEREQ